MTHTSKNFIEDEFLSAIEEGNTNVVSQFIRSYPEKWKEAKNIHEQTPLHLAQNAKITKCLISSGANIEALNKWGDTPFLHAVTSGHSEVIDVLIQRGCNIFSKDNDGNGALAIASQEGHLHTARQLVGMGCSVNETDQDGYTSLHWACQEGHSQTAGFLISSGANIEALDKWGDTPFLCAVTNGHSEVMDVLIQRGCNIFSKNNDGNGALAIASQKGHLNIARQLVGMGCSVNETDQDGYTCTSLHWACQEGHSQTAGFLISSGANIEALDKWGYTPFLCAVTNGHSEVMDVLIQRGCNIFSKDNDGNGALAIASQKGHLNIARQLVGMGCSVNEPHQNGYTSLHWACRKRHSQTAGFLISSGANIEALDKWGLTPFLRAVTSGHSEVMDILIQRGCNIFSKNNNGNGALAIASRKGHLNIAKKLVGMGCSVNEPHQNGYTSLHWACRKGHSQTAGFLISSEANIEALDKWGLTPFLRAVTSGHSEVMDVLIQRGCNIFSKDNNGVGALVFASQKGHLDIARQLVGMGFSVNEPNQNGYTSLYWACRKGHSQTAGFLISSEANIEALDKWRLTPFLRAVTSGHSEVMDVLIQRGCNIFSKDNDGNGALAIASQEGHLGIARQLVGMGFSVNETDQDGYTSLHWASQEGHSQTAGFLISTGANIEALDKWGYTPFLCAVTNGHSEVMDVLIQRGCNIFSKDNDGNGALAIASQEGHLHTAKKLVGMGCSVNKPHQNGCTSLHWASQEGHSQTAGFLISSGANIEALDKWGVTPLLHAVSNGHSEVMDVLIKRGCNIFSKNNDGNGALAIASQKGHLNIARQLVGMGCSVNEPHQNGYTSLHWACQEGHSQTAGFLISAGADTKAENELGRTPLQEADFNDGVAALERILGSQFTDEEYQPEVNKASLEESDVSSDDDETLHEEASTNSEDTGVKSNIDDVRQENDNRSQEIYDEALKRGYVTVNRSRVIVAGQDGAGKSCLVDSLLNRPFEKDKASTEGAAVAMIHTATSGWKVTDSKDHLDPLIAEGIYRMNQQQSTSKSSQESPSELSHFVMESNDPVSRSEEDEADKSEHHYGPSTLAVETLAENLKTVGLEAKTLTANQQQLVNTFLKKKLSEEELTKHILGVRDIWDLGGQEVYLATHSALMPDSKDFGFSMYMVVMDISKSLSDKAVSFHRSSDGKVTDQTKELGWICTNGDFPLYWFGSLTAAHEEAPTDDHWLGKDEEVAPFPVFAIGSHRDVLDSDKERFPDSASVEEWLRGQGELFKQLLSDSDFMKHIVLPDNGVSENFREISHFVERIFLIDNSVSGSVFPCKGVKEIRERVDRMTTTFCKGMKKKQPLFWVYLEILLFRWSKVMKTVIAEIDEIAKLARHPSICNISSRDEVLVALKYLANVGAILYYPEVDGLKDVVFTRPMWVIKALSAFVTAAKPGPYMMPKWNTLKEKGIMSNDLMNYRLNQMRDADSGDLAVVLNDANQELIEEDNKRILRLLELLDVITPVDGSPKTDFYVPSMLKTTFLYSPTYWESLNLSDSEPSRCILPAPLVVIPKKLKFVPECLFFRLITRFLKVYPNRPRLSRHQCIFLVQDKYSPVEVEVELLYHSRGKWVALTIHFIDKEEDPKNISKQLLAAIKNELCKQMKSVCHQGMRGFKYMICCQTKKAVHRDKEFGIDFKRLPVTFEEDCGSSPPPKKRKLYNPKGEPLTVKRDDFQIDCWFGHQLVDARLSSSQDVLPKEINKSLIRVVATLVKAKWEEFAVHLGRNASDMPQYQEKSKENFLRAMMVIEDWVAELGQKATVNALIRACTKCGMNRDNIEAAYKEEL